MPVLGAVLAAAAAAAALATLLLADASLTAPGSTVLLLLPVRTGVSGVGGGGLFEERALAVDVLSDLPDANSEVEAEAAPGGAGAGPAEDEEAAPGVAPRGETMRRKRLPKELLVVLDPLPSALAASAPRALSKEGLEPCDSSSESSEPEPLTSDFALMEERASSGSSSLVIESPSFFAFLKTFGRLKNLRAGAGLVAGAGAAAAAAAGPVRLPRRSLLIGGGCGEPAPCEPEACPLAGAALVDLRGMGAGTSVLGGRDGSPVSVTPASARAATRWLSLGAAVLDLRLRSGTRSASPCIHSWRKASSAVGRSSGLLTKSERMKALHLSETDLKMGLTSKSTWHLSVLRNMDAMLGPSKGNFPDTMKKVKEPALKQSTLLP